MKYVLASGLWWLVISIICFLVYKDLRQDILKMKTGSLYVADVCVYILCLPLTILILLYKLAMIKIK